MNVASWTKKDSPARTNVRSVTEQCTVQIKIVSIQNGIASLLMEIISPTVGVVFSVLPLLREGDKTTIDHLFIKRKEWKPVSAEIDGKEIDITEKMKLGEFNNVLLTPAELLKLYTSFGQEKAKLLIEKLSAYLASRGKRYKSHYATILNWERREKEGKLGATRNTRALPETYTKIGYPESS